MDSLYVLRAGFAVAGAIGIVTAWRLHRSLRIRGMDFLVVTVAMLAVIVVAAHPDSVNLMARALSLEQANFGRLIALLVISTFSIWIFFFLNRISLNDKERLINDLVRALGLDDFRRRYPREAIKPVCVVIPAYNEAENIGPVLDKMPREVEGKEVGALVVVDGGDDGTEDVVESKGVPWVRNKINRGGGAALNLGYDIAFDYGAEIVVTMDGDGQHLPEELGNLVGPILKGASDIVIGSRLLGYREKDSWLRYLGIHVYNRLINLTSHTKISDCSNGYRAFRASELSKIKLTERQFHTSELIIDAARKGMRISEAPVTVLRRSSGESKKGKNIYYGFNFLKTIVKTWLRS